MTTDLISFGLDGRDEAAAGQCWTALGACFALSHDHLPKHHLVYLAIWVNKRDPFSAVTDYLMEANVQNLHIANKRAAWAYGRPNCRSLDAMLIEAILIANNGLRREPVRFAIPEEDWTLLTEFWRHAEVLRSTRFVQEGRGGSIRLNWKNGGPMRMGSVRLEEEPIWAMLLKLRPFVLQNERCYLPSVLKVLKKSLSNRVFHRHLDELRDAYLLKSMNRRMQITGPGRPPLSHQVVMDWLNSFQYHHDGKKSEAVLRDLGPFAKEQHGLSIATFALVDMVQAVLGTGDFLETLQLCHEGSSFEIRCPAEFFNEL